MPRQQVRRILVFASLAFGLVFCRKSFAHPMEAVADAHSISASQVATPFQAVTRNAAIELPGEAPYLQRRARFKTKLIRKGQSPHGSADPKPLDGYRKVTYQSEGLRLKAWVYVPPGIKRPQPGIVHFHGGFGLSHGHFATCRPFVRAGFVVMLPALRAENGNPGDFEMFLAEVDDGRAAIKWLQKQRFVDSKNVYAFGHSAGGIISSMLSLLDDVPIQHSGSSGGLYDVQLFYGLKDRVPFDLTDPVERQLRVLPGNVAWMKRKHYGYVGEDDRSVARGVNIAKQEMIGKASQLQIISQPGDHFKSLTPAMEHYIKLIRDEMNGKTR